MKSLKLTLIAAFALISMPLFGMSLEPILQENNIEQKHESLLNYNLCVENNKNTVEFSSQNNKTTLTIPEKCSVCKDFIQLKKDCIKIKPCKHIMHENCIIDWISNDWSQSLENKSKQCPECKGKLELNNMKFSKETIENLPSSLKSAFVDALKPSILQAPLTYQLEDNKTLAKKSLITFSLVMARLAGNKLPYWPQFSLTLLSDLTDYYYGLMSSNFITSESTGVKFFGKFLYLTASRIIPMYLLNRSLKQTLWNYVRTSYNEMNRPIKLPLFRGKF